ncbi:MAG TPA: redoxin domain-containing protein [Candidatus Polarisedimenticolia bacterium]|nr:redoxin domain-containing protein [Candidatus Polarisedimenticolia bacterium]
MSRLAAALVVSCLMVPQIGWAQAPLRDEYVKRFQGKPAPPFALKDMNGRAVRLSDYRGKVVLLNFWYSACYPCRAETPDLITLYRAHESQGLAVLGINTDALIMASDQGRTLRSFVDTFRIPYPVLVADRKVFEDYGRTPIAPITFLVDPRGTIARVFWGATHGRDFESAVGPYLEARAAGGPSKGAASAPAAP